MINFFKTYVEQLLYVSIFIVLVELILPKGNMKKYVYSISSIIIILLIISPIINNSAQVNIRGAIDNVIQTISKATENSKVENKTVDFNDFKTSVITTSVKDKIEADIKEKFLTIGLEVVGVEIDVTDKYTFDEMGISIKSLGKEENKSVSKASEAISLIADSYKIENSKITITELGGDLN